MVKPFFPRKTSIEGAVESVQSIKGRALQGKMHNSFPPIPKTNLCTSRLVMMLMTNGLIHQTTLIYLRTNLVVFA